MFSIRKEDNIILTDLSVSELTSLFERINSSPLLYRARLSIPKSMSFGNEIEINNLPLNKAVLITELFNDVHELTGDDRYKVAQEETADAEIVTPILSNRVVSWVQFRDMYQTLYETGATFGENTSSHLHIGTHMINTPEKLSLLLKTLVVFEPIIYKFGYGYFDKPRELMTARLEHSIFSPMMCPKKVKNFTDDLDRYNYKNQGAMRKSFLDFLSPDLRFRPVFNFKQFDFSKIHHGFEIDEPNLDDHIEVRCFNSPLGPNGSFRAEIVQNNINLITHIVLAVVEGRIDKKYVEEEYKRYKKKRYNFDEFCAILYDEDRVTQYNRLLEGFSKVKMDKALRLADMIFDTELDKCYFLKQYLKLFSKDEDYIVSLTK